MSEMLDFDFMQRALIAAFVVGAVAPMVGIFIVQRRMSLIGDGMGHVALAGVALGLITSQSPVLTALAAAVGAALVIELLRTLGRTNGDVALAVIFYGGIAAGVIIINKAPGGGVASLNKYLFGAIVTTKQDDLIVLGILALVIVLTVWLLRPKLFAVANDEEYARAMGLPVVALNLVVTVLTAVTVVIAMRVVGLLLISALMIVPNATGQLVARSFGAGLRWAVAFGITSAVGGVVLSDQLDTATGGTIVMLAIVLFILLALITGVYHWMARVRHAAAERHDHEHGPVCGHESIPHGDHVDYVHDGHRHAAHQGHYDEHGHVEASRADHEQADHEEVAR